MFTGILKSIWPRAAVIRATWVHKLKCSQLTVPRGINTKDQLKTDFKCNDDESAKIENYLTKHVQNKADCLKNLAYLYSRGASMSTITENLHLLQIPKGLELLFS